MSTTLFISSTVPESTVVHIREHVRRILENEPDWSGADLEIETGADYTYVDDSSGDTPRAASLLYAVQRIIQIIGGEEENDGYVAYVGEIPNPMGFGPTEEGAIVDAIRVVAAQGGIGPDPHQWPNEDALRDEIRTMKTA